MGTGLGGGLSPVPEREHPVGGGQQAQAVRETAGAELDVRQVVDHAERDALFGNGGGGPGLTRRGAKYYFRNPGGEERMPLPRP